MKISCNIIKDILPLYVEVLASEDTRKIVEDHIGECDDCKKEFEEMKSLTISPMDIDTKPIEKVRDRMRRKNRLTIILTTIITTIVIAIIIIAYVTAPDYINDPMSVTITENSDGMLIAYFDDRITGYEINEYLTDQGYSYNIRTWDSIWDRITSRNRVNSVVLNADGQDVDSVYYDMAVTGWDGTLIYGSDHHKAAGIVTPRYTLAYPLLVATLLIVICIIVRKKFSNNRKTKLTINKVIYLPISYIIGHILILGFTTFSFSRERDFFTIVLVMFGVYAAMLSIDKLDKERF